MYRYHQHLIFTVLFINAFAVPIRHYYRPPQSQQYVHSDYNEEILPDLHDDPQLSVKESLIHVMAVLKEHQDHFHEAAKLLNEDPLPNLIDRDFVIQEDEDDDENIIVVDKKEDPNAVVNPDGDDADDKNGGQPTFSNTKEDPEGEDVDDELGNGRKTPTMADELAASTVVPTPTVTPYRTPTPTRAPNEFATSRYVRMHGAPPSNAHPHVEPFPVGHQYRAYQNSRPDVDDDTDNANKHDNFEKTWDLVLSAARDGLPNDHPLMQHFV